jgi:hypothetical protein
VKALIRLLVEKWNIHQGGVFGDDEGGRSRYEGRIRMKILRQRREG